MAFRYLDKDGALSFWTNIKNYILSKIPTKTSELTNDSGFLTQHQSLSNYVTIDTAQDIEGNKNFKGLLTTIPNDTIWPVTASTTDDITYLGANAIHVEQKSSGKLTDLSGGAWSVAELGLGCFFFRINNGADIRYKNFAQNTVNRIPVVSGANRFINDVTPNENNTYSLGTSSLRWSSCYSNAYYLGTTAFGDIVTHNASEFLTSHQSLSSCVKNVVTNNQTIKSTDITRGTAPSSAQTFGIAFSDNNDKYIGNIYGQYATDKSTYVGLYAYKGTTTANSDNVSVRVGYDASGNAYTYAPTPATADNSTQIATTAFVKAQGYLTSHQSLANYALDANVVHTSGDETIAGKKSFNAMPSILGSYLGNEYSTNARTCLYLKSNRDTDGQSGIYFSKFRQNVAQGALTGSNLVDLSLDVLENSVRTNSCISISFRYFENDVPTKIYVIPKASVTSYMGTTNNPWTSIYGTNIYGSFTGNLTGDVTGNASSATEFSATKDVTLTGDVTGTASSKAGWSVPVTLANSGVTAGTYGPSADVTGSNNATILVPEITVDAKGRVTAVTNRTLTCKNNTYNVYNKTLTIQKNGTNVATFTSNSNTNVTANITVPTKTSELTNDSGFLTSADLLPIGSYIQFAGSQAPDGFLVCNGGEISRITYSALFAVIGTTYGSGDGSTTFNLPNLTDRFLQGSTTSGTVKDAGLPNITGSMSAYSWQTGDPSSCFSSKINTKYSLPSGSTEKRNLASFTFDASRSNSIYGSSSTVQPPALTCLICIKY